MSAVSPKRLKSLSILAVLVVSGLVFLIWTRTWFVFEVTADQTEGVAVEATGESAAPALAALGLAGLAAGAALSIAGRLFRVVLGSLVGLIGASVVLSAVLAIIDPIASSSSAISTATGIAGRDSIAAVVDSVDTSPWPALGVVVGALLVLIGVVVVATAGRWPGPSRKYDAVRFEHADDGAPLDAVDSWDELSRGDDPTR
ncbi:putative membrane protein (TIGR02234 family) [Labedella gwakjiensis]|uniref:Putative membrane protein (TIGR02234 family) n=1 Tax=Labedella gwakjiensis TaxID=390269 RepID=A0A2P8GZU9_9MICO|nr:putative membrane protein (TIGR02234 family) [Labedella gwakjiensis]